MQSRVGTTAIAALPQFADGKLYGCLLEYNALARDTVYRQGGFIKVFGSFGVMMAGGQPAVALKLALLDIDPTTVALTPNAPANSYFIFGTTSSKADLVGKYDSDTPGGQFSVFKPLPTFKQISNALDAGRITVAFNRKDGGSDVLIPLDLTVAATDDNGKKSHSQQMILDFYACTGDLLKGDSRRPK